MDGRFEVTRCGNQCGVAELSQNGLMLDVSFTGSAPDSENVYRLAAVCGGKYVPLGVPVPDKNGKLTLAKCFSKSAQRELGFSEPNAFELVLPGENFGGVENIASENKPEHPAEVSAKENISDVVPEENPQSEPQVIKPVNPQRQGNNQRQGSMQRQNNRQSFEPQVQRHSMQRPVNRPQQKPNSPAKPNMPQKPNVPEKTNAPELSNMPENKPSPRSAGWTPIANPSVMFAENGAISNASDIKGALLKDEGEFVYLAVPVSENEPFPLMSAFCLGEPQTINGAEYLVFKLKNGAFTA